jgi:hypothetical protein
MRIPGVPRQLALALAVLAALFAVPGAWLAGHAASGGSAGPPTASAAAGGSAAPASLGRPSGGIVLTSVTRPAGPARSAASTRPLGLCSVPGIGDIGGLLGFCDLGNSGLAGELNSICDPSLPSPEPANSGIDSLVAPPASTTKPPDTLYQQYGVAGQYWAATNLKCSDMTSLIGNNVAGMMFDAAKSIDRVTITTYQAAAGEGILTWLQGVTDKLITSLGHAIYFPYLTVVVILGAIWLAWQGLIRKRGTRTIEGTIWMVLAAVTAIVLIGRPAAVTGLGTGVSDGMSQALNTAFSKLPAPKQASCVPVGSGDPQAQPSSYSYTSGSTVVDQNADELWTVLVCKPWLDGEFGTTKYSAPGGKPTVVNVYARSLLWAQAIAVNEKPTSSLIAAKQQAYAGIATSLQNKDPAVYPLFQGKQWTTRLEIGFAALFGALVAGVLILLISVTLILLKLSFLLLLIVGPFFLLVGTHPGFGRLVALRWLELLIGVLLKQAAIALVLSVLLYCYALIMGTSDSVLPWALKILMIALVTLAAFIYRKPFQHLFSAAGYGVLGAHDRAEADLARAGSTARANTLQAATFTVPGVAAYRAGRWARRNPAQAASLAAAVASGGAGVAAAGAATAAPAGAAAGTDGAALDPGAAGAAAGADGAGRATLAARARGWAASVSAGSAGMAGQAPPLNLPARAGAADGQAAGPAPAGISGAAAARAGASRLSAGQATASGRDGAPGGPWSRVPADRSAAPRRAAGPAQPAQPARSRAAAQAPARAAPAGQARQSAGQGGRTASSPFWAGSGQDGGTAPGGGPWSGQRRQPAPSGRQSGSAPPRRPGPTASRPSAPRPHDRSAAGGPAGQQGRSQAGPSTGYQAEPASQRRVPFWLRPFRHDE